MVVVYERRTGRLIVDNIARQDSYNEFGEHFDRDLFARQLVHIIASQSMKNWFVGEGLMEIETHPNISFDNQWNARIAANCLREMNVPHFDFYSGQSRMPKDSKPHGPLGELIGIVVEPKNSRHVVRGMAAAQAVYQSWWDNRDLMQRLFGGTMTYPNHLPLQARSAFRSAFEGAS